MSHARPKGSDKARVALRIMATSDVHATLLDYDYSKDRAAAFGALARAATVIEQARVDGPTTLVFDNGDFFRRRGHCGPL